MISRFCQRPDRAAGSFAADLDTNLSQVGLSQPRRRLVIGAGGRPATASPTRRAGVIYAADTLSEGFRPPA